MTAIAVAQCALYLAVLLALSVPLGRFMARIPDGERTWLHASLGPVLRTHVIVRGL